MSEAAAVGASPAARLPSLVHAGGESLHQPDARLGEPLERPLHDWARVRGLPRAARRRAAPSNTSTFLVTRSTFSTLCTGCQRCRSKARELTFTASPGVTSATSSPGCSRSASARRQHTPATPEPTTTYLISYLGQNNGGSIASERARARGCRNAAESHRTLRPSGRFHTQP